MVEKVLIEGGRAVGVVDHLGEIYRSDALILAPGTFLNGLCTCGSDEFSGGKGRRSPLPRPFREPEGGWASAWDASRPALLPAWTTGPSISRAWPRNRVMILPGPSPSGPGALS